MTEENKEELEKKAKEEFDLQTFAKLQQLRLLDINLYPYRLQQRIIGKYKKEEIKKYLFAPETDGSQKQLRQVSRYLYNASSHYKRLIGYFANILKLNYIVEPYGVDVESLSTKQKKDKFKKAYQKTVDLIESLNLKHEITKILPTVFREGVFYGYIHEGNDSFFIQSLDPDYCKISFIDDGVSGISFDFTYFFTYPERLEFFPDEFKQKFEKYTHNNTSGSVWEDLDPDKTICIKYDESQWFPTPPFLGVFSDLLDIEDFKDLRKTQEEIGNYKLLALKMPLNQSGDGVNQYLISLEHATTFQRNVESVVPEQIGVATFPMDVEVINFDRDNVDKNRVADSTSEYWSSAGVAEMLFGSQADNSAALSYSVKTDEALAFAVLKQIERWINRYLKQKNGQFKFRINMLETSIFNEDDYLSNILQLAQYGVSSAKSQLVALSGSQPSSGKTMAFLENEILGYDEWIPLASSHTQSNDGAGRPESADNKISDEGLQTRENDSNNKRAK